MNFKFYKIGQNTNISHDLLYSMARNDDIVKMYYEASSHGVLGWYESESSMMVSAFDPDELDGETDPNWHTICSLIIDPDENRNIKLSLRGLNIVHQTPSNAPAGNTASYRHAMNARFAIQYPNNLVQETIGADEFTSTLAVLPYRFVASGRFMGPNESRQMGRIFGHNLCTTVSEWQQLTKEKPDPNTTFIRPGKSKISLQIKKLDVTQNIIATGENAFQVFVEDVGPSL